MAVRADGGAVIGMGHLVRCGAIARAYMKYELDVCFFSRAESAVWLEENGFACEVLETGTADSETADFVRRIAAWGADAALIDSYEPALDFYRRVLDRVPTIVIDDYVRLPYAAGCIVNANLYAADLDYSRCVAKKLLLGGRYAILREEFAAARQIDVRSKGSRVLVIMGGADANNFTPQVLSALGELGGLKLVVVVGPLFRNADEICRAARECSGEIEIVRSPKKISALMSSCDIAVTAAGSAVYELCSLGVPSVLIGQADNQRLICNYFKRTGSMLYLGEYNQVSVREIRDAVQLLLGDAGLRRFMHERLLTLVCRTGADNIAADTLEAVSITSRKDSVE